MRSKWPKTFPPLSAEKLRINNEFVKMWHEILPNRFGRIERFNHGYPVRYRPPSFLSTLEIGAGLGEHLEYEKLTPQQEREYYSLELRENMCAEIRNRYPRVQALLGNCQDQLPFPDDYFDRVLAIHVLEHLPNLPAAVAEMYRVCNKEHGVISVVIPCEGGFAYSMARRLSAQRVFEKHFKQPYKWFIEREHINRPQEIFDELNPYFTVAHRRFFPFRIPLLFCNLVIGITLTPRLLAQVQMRAA